MFTNIKDAIDWITSQRRNENSFDSFKEIMKELGNPQDDFYSIHVAGTDGKGSTVSYLRDLLMSQGYKVGSLQSPHYLTHLDRIRINNQNITEVAFLRILNKYYDFFVSKHLGMFEMDFMIMCEYFKEEKIDMAVIEVGLGGRLDSTNVLTHPALSIITTIGYDHMDRLGDTLEKICVEKCGIIKPNSKVLVGDLKELKTIVKDIAKQRNTQYFELQEYKQIEPRVFEYKNERYEITSYALYQLHNASLAIEAFEIVANDYGFEVDLNKAKEYLKKSLWQGRFEIIHEKPRIILDGGHNIHGIGSLCESIDKLDGSKLIIFSAIKRKEYKAMCELLKKHSDRLIVSSFKSYEAISLDEFKDEETTDDYIKSVNENINKYDNIILCGSLYFISEIVPRIKEIKY